MDIDLILRIVLSDLLNKARPEPKDYLLMVISSRVTEHQNSDCSGTIQVFDQCIGCSKCSHEYFNLRTQVTKPEWTVLNENNCVVQYENTEDNLLFPLYRDFGKKPIRVGITTIECLPIDWDGIEQKVKTHDLSFDYLLVPDSILETVIETRPRFVPIRVITQSEILDPDRLILNSDWEMPEFEPILVEFITGYIN